MSSQFTLIKFCQIRDEFYAQWKFKTFCEWCEAKNHECISAEIITIDDKSSKCFSYMNVTTEQTWQKVFFKNQNVIKTQSHTDFSTLTSHSTDFSDISDQF